MKEINSDKDLDQLFRDKLSGDTVTPTPQLWKNIEAELDEKKRRPIAWWWLGSVLLLLLLGTAWVLWSGDHAKNKQQTLSENIRSTGGLQEKNPAGDHADKNSDPLTGEENSTGQSSSQQNPPGPGANKTLTNSSPDNSTSDQKTSAHSLSNNSINDPDGNHHTSNNSNTSPHIKPPVNVTTPSHAKDPVTNSHHHDPPPIAYQSTNGSNNANDPFDNGGTVGTSNNSNNNTYGNTQTPPAPDSSKTSSTPDVRVVTHQNASAPKKDSTLASDQTKDPVTAPVPGKDSTMHNEPEKDSTFAKGPKKDSTSQTPRDTNPNKGPLPQEAFKKFYVAMFYGIDINHQSVSGATAASLNNYYTKTASLPNTFALGGRFGLHLSRRFALDAEVNYSTLQAQSEELIMTYWRWANPPPDITLHSTFGSVNFSSSNFDQNDNSRPQTLFGDSVWIRGTVSERYSFITVPLSARFNVVNDKYVKLYVRGGMAANYILAQQMQFTVTTSGKVLSFTSLNGINKINFIYVLGLGTEVKLYKGLGLWVEPGLRYSGTSMNKEGLKNHPYSYFIPAGFIYRF